MAHHLELQEPPKDERARDLWLQHAAGRILFEDVRGYAIKKIDATLSIQERSTVVKGIDDALYGLMMVIDGVTGEIKNHTLSVSLAMKVQLSEHASQKLIESKELRDGDGMCMAYHGWMVNDFGNIPITSTTRTRHEVCEEISKSILGGQFEHALNQLSPMISQAPQDIGLLDLSRQLSHAIRSKCMVLASNKATDGSPEAHKMEALLREASKLNGEGIYG